MKTYGGVDVFLTSALDEGEWPASHPSRLTPGERVPGTHWIGGWVDPTGRLEFVEKRKLQHLDRPTRSQYPASAVGD
jgi:hypothetical protein